MTRYRNAAHRVALLLIALAIGLLFASSCTPRMTYDQWVRNYVSTKVDTTYQTVRLTIPKDSVMIRTRTDTVDYVETVQRGRATLTLKRNRQTTTADCKCDSASIAKTVMQRTEKRTAGVDPKYRDQAETRMTWIWVLVGLIVVGVLVYLFGHQLKISRR